MPNWLKQIELITVNVAHVKQYQKTSGGLQIVGIHLVQFFHECLTIWLSHVAYMHGESQY